MRLSIAMTGGTHAALASHLLRADGQEDLCFASWRPSTGYARCTSIIGQAILPGPEDRHVHGNVSFQPGYVLRAAEEAVRVGGGLAFMHSHPGGRGWQGLNDIDRTAEARVANLAREITGLPLVGMTLASDCAWAARVWDGAGRRVEPLSCESVRVLGDVFSVSFDDGLVPVPRMSETQVRTVSTWGEEIQGRIARLRVAVAGAGSVGMVIADVLARTGIQHVGVFDFDTVELKNLDRLRGARRLDAVFARSKVQVARRLLAEASTAARPRHEFHELSICEPDGLERLLDYDIIFSCVDRPWPRHVLNTVAYADLIPVVEGGISAFQNSNGSFRNAYWSSTLVRPGRPCLACLGQYDPGMVQVERDGSLDDPYYIANLPAGSPARRRENVAALSTCAAAALLQQFIAYVAHPSGLGDTGQLRFSLRDHTMKAIRVGCTADCPYPASAGCGDGRLDPSSRHRAAEDARARRRSARLSVRAGRHFDDLVGSIGQRLRRFMVARSAA